MDQSIIDNVRSLRLKLHDLAERSGQEQKTKACLMEFFKKNTSLQIVDYGQWFCAIHEETNALQTIAFRAEMDALESDNGASHLCGHDGHSAVLAGLGLLLENRKLGRNIVIIFQHAEENGVGGKVCAEGLKKYNVSYIFAFHNIPGWDEGVVLLRRDTFACASTGMTISFIGSPSHAAYPQNGLNPGFAVARFISFLQDIIKNPSHQGIIMITLIGAEIGSKSFGTAAANAEVWLTLRAAHQKDMCLIISKIKKTASNEAFKDSIKVEFSFSDVFPPTINDNDMIDNVEKICKDIGLACINVSEPFFWSEDFGHYNIAAKPVMLGIGSSKDWPQLHTQNYTFNDNIIPTALKLFSSIAELD